MRPSWTEPPPVPDALWEMLDDAIKRHNSAGHGYYVVPIRRDPARRAWLEGYEAAQRATAAREEWPWPERPTAFFSYAPKGAREKKKPGPGFQVSEE